MRPLPPRTDTRATILRTRSWPARGLTCSPIILLQWTMGVPIMDPLEGCKFAQCDANFHLCFGKLHQWLAQYRRLTGYCRYRYLIRDLPLYPVILSSRSLFYISPHDFPGVLILTSYNLGFFVCQLRLITSVVHFISKEGAVMKPRRAVTPSPCDSTPVMPPRSTTPSMASTLALMGCHGPFLIT